MHHQSEKNTVYALVTTDVGVNVGGLPGTA